MLPTRYEEDFTWPEASGWGIKKWPKNKQQAPEVTSKSIPVYRNNETLSQLSEEHLPPFNLLLQPKPIVQTYPLTPIPIQEFPKDDGSARLTRSRVYKAPEISLDDIDDSELRQQIIDYTYSTTSGSASQETRVKTTKREIPNSTWELPDHVLFAREEGLGDKMCEDMVDDRLNEWEKRQSRTLGDATTSFWKQYRANKPLKILDQSATDIKSPEFTEKILCTARVNSLRFPFTIKPEGYTGFTPDNPIGIEPAKPQLEFSDPMLTCYQIANRWRDHCDSS